MEGRREGPEWHQVPVAHPPPVPDTHRSSHWHRSDAHRSHPSYGRTVLSTDGYRGSPASRTHVPQRQKYTTTPRPQPVPTSARLPLGVDDPGLYPLLFSLALTGPGRVSRSTRVKVGTGPTEAPLLVVDKRGISRRTLNDRCPVEGWLTRGQGGRKRGRRTGVRRVTRRGVGILSSSFLSDSSLPWSLGPLRDNTKFFWKVKTTELPSWSLLRSTRSVSEDR